VNLKATATQRDKGSKGQGLKKVLCPFVPLSLGVEKPSLPTNFLVAPFSEITVLARKYSTAARQTSIEIKLWISCKLEYSLVKCTREIK
jgi:hypothetical protein